MNICINNHMHTQSYNPTVKSDKTAIDGFSIPDMKDTSVTDESESHVSGNVDVDENGIIQNHLRSRARVLPQGIGMNLEQFLAYMETKTAKIVFEFGEGGSIRIKEGLSQADYLRAKQSLRETELWRQGKSCSLSFSK